MAPQVLKITLVAFAFSHFQHGLRSSLIILRCRLLSSRPKCGLPCECSGINGLFLTLLLVQARLIKLMRTRQPVFVVLFIVRRTVVDRPTVEAHDFRDALSKNLSETQ